MSGPSLAERGPSRHSVLSAVSGTSLSLLSAVWTNSMFSWTWWTGRWPWSYSWSTQFRTSRDVITSCSHLKIYFSSTRSSRHEDHANWKPRGETMIIDCGDLLIFCKGWRGFAENWRSDRPSFNFTQLNISLHTVYLTIVKQDDTCIDLFHSLFYEI